jgi:hypothetical protein
VFEIDIDLVEVSTVFDTLGVWNRLQSLSLDTAFLPQGSLRLIWASTATDVRKYPFFALPNMDQSDSDSIIPAGLRIDMDVQINPGTSNFLLKDMALQMHKGGDQTSVLTLSVKPDFVWVAKMPFKNIQINDRLVMTKGNLVFGDRIGLRPKMLASPNPHMPVSKTAPSPFLTYQPKPLVPAFGMTTEEREACFVGLQGQMSVPITHLHSEIMEVLVLVLMKSKTGRPTTLWASTRLLGLWRDSFDTPRSLVSVLNSDFTFQNASSTLPHFAAVGLVGFGEPKGFNYIVGDALVFADWSRSAGDGLHYSKTTYQAYFVQWFFQAFAGRWHKLLPPFVLNTKVTGVTSTWSAKTQTLSNEGVMPRGFQFQGTMRHWFGQKSTSIFTANMLYENTRSMSFLLNVSSKPMSLGVFKLIRDPNNKKMGPLSLFQITFAEGKHHNMDGGLAPPSPKVIIKGTVLLHRALDPFARVCVFVYIFIYIYVCVCRRVSHFFLNPSNFREKIC